MGEHPTPRSKLLRLLKRYGVREEHKSRSGDRRLVRQLPDGRKIAFTLRFHGHNETIQPSIIRALRRRFQLTAEDGHSDEEFYRGK